MLTAHHLTKAYGLQTILKDISFSINAGERVGLIGPNGCGKSTLMRILTGRETADRGHVSLTPAELTIGYLAQGFEPDPAQTLGAILHDAAGDPARLEAELIRLAQALADAPQDAALQQAYDRALQRLNQTDIGKAQALLAAFELDQLDPQQRVGTLSGGQKTRLALALLLLSSPQLLLLDEPTNHLDIEMLEWLETWLIQFSGGVLIISHDRAFLDKTAQRILDLDPHTHTLREYAGGYTDYLEQYLAEREKQWSDYNDQQQEIRRMQRDIARTRAQAERTEREASSARIGGGEMKLAGAKDYHQAIAKKVARKAKAREKKLDRYLDGDDRVEKPKQSWQMKLELADTPHLGKDVLRLIDLSVGYAGYPPLLTNITLDLQAGERVVLAGPNGSGKTTLLRTIAGKLPAQHGDVRLGASVRLGYMTQEQEQLDPAATALSTIQDAAPLNQTEARSFLHYFLFSGDDPLRPIGQLSYGERARLSLARLVASGCNFLLLDEPINHLDIPSRTQFEEALAQFEGTVLAVVHDRYFIDRFATTVWQVGNGRLSRVLR